ncbi:Cation-independent mannose-6-phosphate receptor CI-MPR [Pichia californica]|uniref:Cation-independent mannose-6-phosphate receptor CI-MPR n=1 Tax=Pichia californica TaxID=460514 RepID=A0A9P6WGF6_9ASCO|nr:Cation-independent mannose-6-phosphate receptor CI-MPR [[Candida] californica]KAG0686661.1 Cation-independent mannose-6-phosphate receptor CI-MPR [[Candida] californica]
MSIFLGRKRVLHIACIIVIIIFVLTRESPSTHNSISKEIFEEFTNNKDSKIDSSTQSPSSSNNDDHITEDSTLTSAINILTPEDHILEPCTIINPLTNQFYDLRPLSSIGNDGEIQAWNAKGFDYGKNFSIGICSTPLRQLKALKDDDFTDSFNKSNIGGYYTNKNGNKVSIGAVSTDLKFRGLNMVLEYENGDRCENTQNLFKSTLLTFKCDREMMSKARVNYLGSMDNCSYFFEVRTVHACATSNDETDNAVWGIFILIIFSALGVYFFAGFIYKIIKSHYENSIKKDPSIV